ncbi:hypothetical protein E2C01_093727 [Portunus trituberculatus]|uniref:Uncharacterized protein n=1 Tax=Portunus trituberculatus TaxID=210409 RepID=A0A5B7JU99_PORTR|nr:hypothetical protein [Portunus trituberculatus]
MSLGSLKPHPSTPTPLSASAFFTAIITATAPLKLDGTRDLARRDSLGPNLP